MTREQKIKKLLKIFILDAHQEEKRFMAGFSYNPKIHICVCSACEEIRKLYPELKNKS